MDIPKSFKPEKNLEDDTNRLLTEEIKLPEPVQSVEKKELEGILEEFDPFDYKSVRLQEKIENMIGKKGYKPVSLKKKYFRYWAKQNPQDLEESYVFIRGFDEKGRRRYSFATTDTKSLEEFCKLFDGVVMRSNHGPTHNRIRYLAGGFVAGIAIGALVGYIVSCFGILPDYTKYPTLMNACIGSITGMMVGYGTGGLTAICIDRKEAKKMNKIAKIEFEDKEALKLALK